MPPQRRRSRPKAKDVPLITREGEQVGWVPRDLAARLAPELDAGASWSAIVLREQRRSPRDPRHGLTMLLAPSAELVLRAV